MATRQRDLIVRFKVNDRELKGGFDSSERSAHRWGTSIAKFAGLAALGIGAAGAVAVKFGMDFVEAAEDAQKVTRQTNAVLKSTGGVANVTANEVANLAEQLSLKAGIDDELIQSGENVLLTFTNIRNEVGRGNDIFNQATTAALDMSVALGQDMQSSVIQLGKALNDPVRGITALRRVGVAFTEQQQDQIKALVESGDLLGAQKIILAELTKEFGGSAAAQATASGKIRVALGNVAEKIGTLLLPYVERFSNWLAEEGIPLLENEFLPALENVFNWIESDAIPVIEDLVTWLQENVVPAFQAVSDGVERNWPQIQETISSVMESIQAIVSDVIEIVQVLWRNFGDNILAYVQAAWPYIQGVIEGALRFIQGVVHLVLSIIKGDWSGAWDAIKMIVSGAWEVIKSLVGLGIERIKFIFGVGLEIVKSVWGAAWNWIKEKLRGIGDWITDKIGAIKNAVSSLPGVVRSIGHGLWEGLKSGLVSVVNWIIDRINSIINAFNRIPVLPDIGNISHVGGGGGHSTRPSGGGGASGPPVYDTGGVVPGSYNRAVPVIAHGSEMILNPTQQARLFSQLNGGGGGRQDIYVHLTGDLLKVLRVEIAANGGNVQAVLGK